MTHQLPAEAFCGLSVPLQAVRAGQVVGLTLRGELVAELHPAGTEARLRALQGAGGTRPSFTCPRCGRTSWHPTDVLEGFCGACHDWTGERRQAV